MSPNERLVTGAGMELSGTALVSHAQGPGFHPQHRIKSKIQQCSLLGKGYSNCT